MQLTLVLPIYANSETESLLKETIKEYTNSFNRVCKLGWQESRINGVELHKKSYREERKTTRLPSQLICAARVKAVEALKSTRALIRKGKKASLPQSDSCPIRYDARSTTINLALGTATLASIAKRQTITFKVPEHHRDKIEWKVCSADLCLTKKNRLYLHVVVEKEMEQFIACGKVLGVDLGIARPAVTSENAFLGSRYWSEVNERNYRLRKALQANGTKSAKRHLRKLRGKENRFRTNCDHILANSIVSAAGKGTVIVLEDLKEIRSRAKGTKKQKRRMHSWSFSRLAFFITYKAEMLGALVAYINPRYTSQECSKCGYQDKRNRKTQAWFCCKNCSFQLNADLNAAKNIRARYQPAPP
jgi:putative transposase